MCAKLQLDLSIFRGRSKLNKVVSYGACIRIGKSLEKELVWIGSRHHTMEVILGDVYHVILVPLPPVASMFIENF